MGDIFGVKKTGEVVLKLFPANPTGAEGYVICNSRRYS